MNFKGGIIAYNELYWGTNEHDIIINCNKHITGRTYMEFYRLEQYRQNNLDLLNFYNAELPLKYDLIDDNNISIPKLTLRKGLKNLGTGKIFPNRYMTNITLFHKHINELGRAVGIIDERDKSSTFSEKGFIGICHSLTGYQNKEKREELINYWDKANSNFSFNFYGKELSNSFVDGHLIGNLPTSCFIPDIWKNKLDFILFPVFTEGRIVEDESELLEWHINGLTNEIKKKAYSINMDCFINNYIHGINTYQDDLIIESISKKLQINRNIELEKIRSLNLFKILKTNIKAELSSCQIRKGGEYEASYNFATTGIESGEHRYPHDNTLKQDKYLSSFKFHPKCGKSLGTWNFEDEVNQLTESIQLNFIKNYSIEKHLETMVYQASIRKLMQLNEANEL